MNDFIAAVGVGVIMGVIIAIFIQFVPGRISRNQGRINTAHQAHLGTLDRRIGALADRLTAWEKASFTPITDEQRNERIAEWNDLDQAWREFRATHRLVSEGDDHHHEPGS